MLKYVVRRIGYSILVIFGVAILTFVLFHLAAGDPAAAVLGQHATPVEVEELRTEMGADLPLFFGFLCQTEAFPDATFGSGQSNPGIELAGKWQELKNSVELREGASVISVRNFSMEEMRLECHIECRGKLLYKQQRYSVDRWSTLKLPVNPQQRRIVFATPCEGKLLIRRIRFYRRQDSPLNSQFIRAMTEICSLKPDFPYISFFNFGQTIITREPINRIIQRGIFPSLALMIPIFIGELLLGVALALLATAFKDSYLDRTIVLLSVGGMSISYLVFIIFGQWFFGYRLSWFPVWGWGGVNYLILPVVIGIMSGLGGGVRFYRTVFVNELNREYLRTATAKSCSRYSIYARHLLRNALIPIITRASSLLPFLFTGSLLLETFFGIPGLGYLGVEALNNSDLQLLKALVIISAMLFVTVNLLTDIAYAWVDPRIRLNAK